MKISTIVVTRNRATLLKNCLDSLAHQTKRPDEVVVVDNNSNDNTKDVINNFKKRLFIRYVFEPRVGIPIARNSGIKNAKHDVIAFIDDDCIVDKRWVKTILRITKNYNPVLIQGSVKPLLRKKLFSDIYQLFFQDLLDSYDTKNKFWHLFTGNLIVPKKIFKKVGYFDEKFKVCEDTELGIRLQQKGYEVLYSPNIIAYHNHRTDFISFAEQQFTSGKYAYLLKQKYKEDLSYLPKDLQNIYFLLGSLFIMPLVNTFRSIKILGFKSAIKLFPLIFLQKVIRYSGFFVMSIEDR